MSFNLFVVVGLAAGVILHGIAFQRFRFALPLGLLVGLLSAFIGGILGNLVAGAPLGQIRPSAVAGTSFAAFGAIAVMAILAHRKHLEQEGQLQGRIWSLTPARRRSRA